ncbi:hypothetical protein K490DRAFT_60474 [Saccharata proteae CBS 121410]|uniref:Glutamyl-tRNA synthetase n=1 Tax=Saccharata proteae CBS 121410 TaxID=1314787 RepID=A0A9P4LVX3_9PEZI|nr:hypothetical protein K490DRAFT_60474 [Saccharata proteae CBS 121410]
MSSPFEKALAAIDAAHAQDPTKIVVDGVEVPYELHYARKCSHYLELRCPDDASDALKLAIRAQHLRRWEIPRSSYPMTKPGYLSWRTSLKNRQAELATSICVTAGVAASTAERVGALVRKENLRKDAETMVLEDVACLVFLDDQFDEFRRGHDEEKIVGILRKTWAKMSEEGRRLALGMGLEGRSRELVEKALAG